mgnify:FL=1
MRRREKKSKYLRGWRTHSWGRVGQHRKSGQSGGRGRAGLLKHKKSWLLKATNGELYPLIGKHGFVSRFERVGKVINVGELEALLAKLTSEGAVEVKEGKYVVDLTKLGYVKLLGEGKVSKPIVVKVKAASAKAIKAIKEAGGEVMLIQGG